MMRGEFGPRCAEAFLGAWLAQAGTLERDAHAKFMPSAAEMRQYLEVHP